MEGGVETESLVCSEGAEDVQEGASRGTNTDQSSCQGLAVKASFTGRHRFGPAASIGQYSSPFESQGSLAEVTCLMRLCHAPPSLSFTNNSEHQQTNMGRVNF